MKPSLSTEGLQRRRAFLHAIRGHVGPRSLTIPASGTPRQVVYLDKDAHSLLWTSKAFSTRELLQLRRRLTSPHFKNRPTLLISQWLLSEMSSRLQNLRVEQQIARELQLLTQLPTLLFLKAPPEVLVAEICAVLQGGDPDVFLEAGSELPLDVDEAWFEELHILHKDRTGFAAYHTKGHARTRANWPDWGFLIKNLNREFLTDTEDAVRKLALKFMRVNPKALGLTDDESTWPDPRKLRAAWAHAAHAVKYAHLCARDQRKPRPNDFHDWCHYFSAAYADVFVTNDDFSRRVAEGCPPPGPRVMSFEDWVRDILSAGTS